MTLGRDDAVVDRAEGVLLGLSCGDALGRPVEFESPARILAQYGTVTEMLGHGTWNKPAGTVTDDTDLACCLAESLVECGGFDPADVARRFVEWFDSGPFDVGGMTSRSLVRIKAGDPWDVAGETVLDGAPEGSNAGNGSVMRVAPLAIPYADDPAVLRSHARDSSRITHADPRCTEGCAVLALVVADFITADHASGAGSDPAAILAEALAAVDPPAELRSALTGLDSLDEADLGNSGYVVHTLQTALYHALTAESAEEAIVCAVNEGGDADTIGAVAGAVAGARFGAAALPDRWLDDLPVADELRRLARDLTALDVGDESPSGRA